MHGYMHKTAMLSKVKRGDNDGMDVEETFGDGISAPLSPLPESEVGTGGLGESEDEGAVPPIEEDTVPAGDETAEEW